MSGQSAALDERKSGQNLYIRAQEWVDVDLATRMSRREVLARARLSVYTVH